MGLNSRVLKVDEPTKRKVNPNIKEESKMGYRDDSPYRDMPYINIHTPNGTIDMSETGIPLYANGQLLMPYSGLHQFDTNEVKEVPVFKNGGWLEKYQNGRQVITVNSKDDYRLKMYNDSIDLFNRGRVAVNNYNKVKDKWRMSLGYSDTPPPLGIGGYDNPPDHETIKPKGYYTYLSDINPNNRKGKGQYPFWASTNNIKIEPKFIGENKRMDYIPNYAYPKEKVIYPPNNTNNKLVKAIPVAINKEQVLPNKTQTVSPNAKSNVYIMDIEGQNGYVSVWDNGKRVQASMPKTEAIKKGYAYKQYGGQHHYIDPEKAYSFLESGFIYGHPLTLNQEDYFSSVANVQRDEDGNIEPMPEQDEDSNDISEYDNLKMGGKVKGLPRGFTSKNIQSSINKIFARNYDLYGDYGRKFYSPKMKEGGVINWLDKYNNV